MDLKNEEEKAFANILLRLFFNLLCRRIDCHKHVHIAELTLILGHCPKDKVNTCKLKRGFEFILYCTRLYTLQSVFAQLQKI